MDGWMFEKISRREDFSFMKKMVMRLFEIARTSIFPQSGVNEEAEK